MSSTLSHADGQYRWMLGTGTVTVDATGTPIRMSGANVDITERKQLEMEFIQAQKMESVGRLAGGVAHDFNNLLAVIGGYTEMAMAELPEDARLHRDLTQIKHAADRAANLTRQLLAFSRRQVLRPEVLDINKVITDAEKMLRRLIGEDIQVDLQLTPELGHVMVDPGQLEQVLMNLVVNSRDAMPKGGTVTIATKNSEHELECEVSSHEPSTVKTVCLSVSDTGTGMGWPPQERRVGVRRRNQAAWRSHRSNCGQRCQAPWRGESFHTRRVVSGVPRRPGS